MNESNNGINAKGTFNKTHCACKEKRKIKILLTEDKQD